VQPRPVPGPPARKWEALEERLPAQVFTLTPTSPWPSTAVLFEEQSGIKVSTATMSRALKWLGLPLKKAAPGFRARRAREGSSVVCC
jgi:transposase